jgi:hypothetical protein
LPGGAIRARGTIGDGALRTHRPRLAASAITAPLVTTASVPGSPALTVRQSISQSAPDKLASLAILVDGSVDNEAAGDALAKALDGIAPGTPVSLTIAGDDLIRVASAPWSPEQKAKFSEALDDADYEGDNIAALTRLTANAQRPADAILWVHGPQPVAFAASQAALEQWLDREGGDHPKLVRYQLTPGRAFTLEGQPWFDTARMVTPGANPAADLSSLLSDLTGTAPRWQTTRSQVSGSGSGSPHIVRLWGAGQLAATPKGDDKRERAIALAHRLNIITPVSGAVVLETKQDYKDNGLPVPGGDEVPSVPEPHEWALMLMLALVMGWMIRSRRREQAVL